MVRRYNTITRRKILDKINKIESTDDILNIFKIIRNESFTENNTGIYCNLQLLKDDTIAKLLEYCDKIDFSVEPIIKHSYNAYST